MSGRRSSSTRHGRARGGLILEMEKRGRFGAHGRVPPRRSSTASSARQRARGAGGCEEHRPSGCRRQGPSKLSEGGDAAPIGVVGQAMHCSKSAERRRRAGPAVLQILLAVEPAGLMHTAQGADIENQKNYMSCQAHTTRRFAVPAFDSASRGAVRQILLRRGVASLAGPARRYLPGGAAIER